MATAKPTRNEAHERAGADPRAVCAGPPRLCAVRAGAPHPHAVSAVSAGPPPPRACTPLGDKVPPQRAFDAVRAGPPSSFQQLCELAERHKREDADIRAALRRARAARRPAWRPPVLYARPREGGARMVVASGRDGSGEREDGSGDGDGPAPPRLKSKYGPRAEVSPPPTPRSRAPRVLDGRAPQ